MVEPEHFNAVKARRQALANRRDHTEEEREFLRIVPLQLFNRGIRFQTLAGVLFAAGDAAGGMDSPGLAADDSELALGIPIVEAHRWPVFTHWEASEAACTASKSWR
jgi:hypothetical protein